MKRNFFLKNNIYIPKAKNPFDYTINHSNIAWEVINDDKFDRGSKKNNGPKRKGFGYQVLGFGAGGAGRQIDVPISFLILAGGGGGVATDSGGGCRATALLAAAQDSVEGRCMRAFGHTRHTNHKR